MRLKCVSAIRADGVNRDQEVSAMNLYQDIERFEKWLGEFDTRIDELRHMVAGAHGYRQMGLQGELDKLLARRHKAQEHLAEIKLVDAESWQHSDFRSSVLALFDDIGKHLDALLPRAAE
jgi:hypothetical protein